MFFSHKFRRLEGFAALWAAACLCVPTLTVANGSDFEHFTANVQSTWVWQKHPSFYAPYSGFSSLNANGEIGSTLTGTAFLGARPWKGTEFFLDPEVAKGNPFSGLRGFGGITNGEAQKAGNGEAVTYLARAFVRQTIGYRQIG